MSTMDNIAFRFKICRLVNIARSLEGLLRQTCLNEKLMLKKWFINYLLKALSLEAPINLCA